MTRHEERRSRTGRRLLVRAVAWLVILVAGAALAAAVVVPRLAGATPYVVLTGSMTPDLPAGSLVVVRPVAAQDVRTGDVVTYQLRSGEPTVVTHRVVGKGIDQRGEVLLLTRGDANDSPDDAWVRPVQLRGELWYAVPLVGHVTNLLSGDQRNAAARLVGLGLLVLAAVELLGAARERRTRPHHRVEGSPRHREHAHV